MWTNRMNPWTRRLSASLAMTLLVGVAAVVGEGEASAQPPRWQPPEPVDVASVPVSDRAAVLLPSWTAESRTISEPPSVQWPDAGSAVADLSNADADAPTPSPALGGHVQVGTSPVWLASTEGDVASVEVTVADRATTEAANVAGVLVSLQSADTAAGSGKVGVALDYRPFADAFGGDWAARLRLVHLPSCALTTPDKPECLESTVLPTDNDTVGGTLSAEVTLQADSATVLAVEGGPSSDNGDYTATSLSPAGTWQVSAQTGDFSWSYPMRMPPSLGGAAPPVSLAYSSGSVDGRTGMTNTQGSWIGDGWDSWSGYIERKYVGCADDKDAVGGQNPNNASHPTGDQCWKTLNATVSLNGRAGELIQVGSSSLWRLKNDDGTRFELLSDPARGNGDDNNEYWKVTTPDGVKYFFGYHKLPGGAVTDSTWTVPVAGNHPGEPCHASGFAGSFCPQAWRWNLDYVVDPHNNTTAYHYGKELNGYGKDNDPDQRVDYVRGGWLDHIDYGMRAGAESSAAPLRVVFSVADRCTISCYMGTPPKPNPVNWPDTPLDQACPAAPCTNKTAPTFWTMKRLASVTTKVLVSGTTYQDVESWALRHVFLDAGEGEGKPMWLAGVSRSGKVTRTGGPQVSDPEIVFDAGAEPLPNRIDGPGDGRTALNRFRIKSITGESGGQILVTYSLPDCTKASLPTPHTNTKRCMPQFYAPPGGGDPTLDWFHKYVVNRVDLIDGVGQSATQTTFYDYLDAPAWHYNDDELTPDKYKTWGDWRGYGKVRIRSGDANGAQTAVETHYLRGMHGDHLPSGSRNVVVPDSLFGGSIQDHEALQGFVREEITYNGFSGGTTGAEVTASWHDPWKAGPTASRTRLGITTQAWMVQTATTRTRTALEAGGHRVTRTVTGYNGDGLPVTTDELGDEAVNGDDRCTRTSYARNDSIWMIDKVKQTETLSVSCAGAPDPALPATVLSRSRTFHDNPDDFNAAPTRGLVVKTEELASFTGSTPVYDVTARSSYDAYGRVTEAYDALDNKTTTAYTPASGGPVTQTKVTNPLSQAVTTTKEPGWDLPTKISDANGLLTEFAYDGLGRVLKIWLPGRSKATQSPNTQFGYQPRKTAPTAVTTQTLLPNGSSYKTSINLYDGFLRLRQNQTQATGGGRLVTDTVYDAGGRTGWESAAYYNGDSGPSSTLVTTSGQPQIPAVTEHVYDGAGRETTQVFKARGAEAWRTTTRYGGDRVHTTPPAGGVATTALTDVWDHTVELRQYRNPADVGSNDPARFERTTYGYTKTDELASVTDPGGNVWRYTIDLRGRTTQVADPDKGTNTSTFDKAGNVLTSTDGRGITLGYTYDKLGRKTSVRDGSPSGARRAEWVYDTLPNGIGKLTKSIRWLGSSAYESRIDGYDSAGRPAGTSTIIPASEGALCAAGGTTPCVFTTTSSYKANGATATSGLPAAADLPAETLTYAYNDIGEPSYYYSPGQAYVYSATYNKLGQLTQRQLGGYGNRAVATYTFDEPTRRLANTNVVPELKPEAANYTYSYNPAGLVTKISDTPVGQTADHQCLRYDHLQRLTEAWTPGNGDCGPGPTVSGLGGPAKYWTSWTLDATGNRTSQVAHASGGDTTSSYAHPASGPSSVRPHSLSSVTTAGPGGSSTRSYTYDNAGSTTGRPSDAGVQQSLTWDPEGHLASLTENTKVSRFIYDADGNRLLRKDASANTLYLPSGTEISVATGSATGKATRYYTHKDETIAVRTASTLHWLVGDHHGTAEQAVNNSGLSLAKRRSFPYGSRRGSVSGTWPGAMDKGFVGGTSDPTGLTHLGAREYDPSVGRFISVDPVIDPADPQQLHPYAYSNNNPTSFADPDGQLFGFVKKAASAVASAASSAGHAVSNFAVGVVQSIKEDPLKFAVGLAVGVAAVVAVAAVCSTGIGCVILAGAVAGAAAAGAEYGVDVAQGEREFSASDLAKEMAIGGAVGAVGAGAGVAGGKALSAARAARAARHADDLGEEAAGAGRHADDLAEEAATVGRQNLVPEGGGAADDALTPGRWQRFKDKVIDFYEKRYIGLVQSQTDEANIMSPMNTVGMAPQKSTAFSAIRYLYKAMYQIKTWRAKRAEPPPAPRAGPAPRGGPRAE